MVYGTKKISHTMVVKSINNHPTRKGPPAEYRVELMDDALLRDTIHFYRNTVMTEDGFILMDGKARAMIDKIRIIPDEKILKDICLSKNWTQQGMDHNGTDGWSLALNTTQLEEGYHFIRATMVDSNGSNGTQTTEIFVDNIPPVPGDHDLAITEITACETNITVTVENQGRNNETTYVSVYYERIDPTLRVDLESGASTALTFEWTPSCGWYKITGEADPVLDEVDTSDNELTTIVSVCDGTVTVTWLGDLDADYDVDEDDVWHFCRSFNNYYKIDVKDPLCDFDCDCDIDEDDLWKFCGAFIDYYK